MWACIGTSCPSKKCLWILGLLYRFTLHYMFLLAGYQHLQCPKMTKSGTGLLGRVEHDVTSGAFAHAAQDHHMINGIKLTVLGQGIAQIDTHSHVELLHLASLARFIRSLRIREIGDFWKPLPLRKKTGWERHQYISDLYEFAASGGNVGCLHSWKCSS